MEQVWNNAWAMEQSSNISNCLPQYQVSMTKKKNKLPVPIPRLCHSFVEPAALCPIVRWTLDRTKL